MNSDEYLASVREQYENFPYPKRPPEDEKRTLFVTTTEHIGNISHYCFGGKRDLRDGARCLVAGGGTGDAALFLSEQLRNTNAEVVYVDLSRASMGIAHERAEVRGLTNITWLQRSLLELPDMDIGTFDYINCCGVLHHLDDPVKGLNALSSVLKEEGAMGIMVYAQYGRTAIYQMQELMRLINTGENNLQQCIDNTHLTIAELPEDNWYRRDEARWKGDLEELGDIEAYDLFLHSQDRAYTVPQVYNWLDECHLNLVSFTGFTGHKLKYIAGTYVRNKKLQSLIDKTPIDQQQSIAELISGNIKTP
ncbi:MAG TPA: class I SAM-dependent methyltransferase [Gammaproteobacteria bacterium]|nr:class I SAM-dependent methyltransferase [Gammaproteobacteria bacterium]